jgi:hypothetical protein
MTTCAPVSTCCSPVVVKGSIQASPVQGKAPVQVEQQVEGEVSVQQE